MKDKNNLEPSDYKTGVSNTIAPLEALCYLDDIAHGRKMEYDAHELKLLIEEALEDIDYLKVVNKNQRCLIKMLIEENRTMKKALKALEIIKKRECLFKGLSETTQEEFDLLKEVLL